ncbi:MAG: TRAP transporter substrate-binding protein DctP [Phycisphaerales bacterium]
MRKITLSLVSAAAIGALTAPALAQETTLRGVTSFAQGTTFSRPWEAFVERVNETGGDLIAIEYIGGPEAIPPFEVGNAVQSGVVDIANVTSAFYGNLLPEGDALHLATNTIQAQRENGCYDLVNQLHEERMNAHYLARTGDGIPFHLYLTQPIDGPDLSGLTIRVTPVYRAFFAELGANLVQTAPGEVYTALERGAIDGYGWPVQGMLDLGWEEQTGYRVDPGFYQVDVNILINLDVWEGLSDQQRAVLEEAAIWVEAQNAGNEAINAEERAAQEAAGVEAITFSEAQTETWLQTAQDAGWAAVEEINADLAAELRACLTAG